MAGQKIKSEGLCCYCGKSFSKQSMSRHLAAHLKSMEKEAAPGGKSMAFHLEVVAGPFFLHLLMPANLSLGKLDGFLRGIWLECCGHLSSFSLGGWGSLELDMRYRAGKVFNIYPKLVYRYDFGSTTQLEVSVKGNYALDGKAIVLLSRNEPLLIMCHLCGKMPAEHICMVHIYDRESCFCTACSKLHRRKCPDFREYARMPVVNSPRAGVCGYEGGSIDKARDGVYKMPVAG